jgi:hypothetical protein
MRHEGRDADLAGCDQEDDGEHGASKPLPSSDAHAIELGGR